MEAKDSWNRKEVEELVHKAYTSGQYDTDDKNRNVWIKENL